MTAICKHCNLCNCQFFNVVFTSKRTVIFLPILQVWPSPPLHHRHRTTFLAMPALLLRPPKNCEHCRVANGRFSQCCSCLQLAVIFLPFSSACKAPCLASLLYTGVQEGQISMRIPCQRPYHAENTSSRPIPEVKQHWARLVLGWETAWEPLVQLASLLSFNLGRPASCEALVPANRPGFCSKILCSHVLLIVLGPSHARGYINEN